MILLNSCMNCFSQRRNIRIVISSQMVKNHLYFFSTLRALFLDSSAPLRENFL